MKTPIEVSLHAPENVLHAVQIILAEFGEKVSRQHRPQSGAFFLGAGYLWGLALDQERGILAALAIEERWPLDTATIMMFNAPAGASEVDAKLVQVGVHGFLGAITQGKVVDDESRYPLLLGPFRFLTGQMGACAEQQARGHGNN